MHAFLVTGSSSQTRRAYIDQRLETWRVSPFDVVSAESEGPHIGIETIRSLTRRLILKPAYSANTVCVVRNADLMTIEAQNALLKILEEPPIHVAILLETANISLLLPTIVSRCQVVDLGATPLYTEEERSRYRETIEQISRQPLGKRFKLIEELVGTREEATAWVEVAIAATREAMLSSFGSHRTRRMSNVPAGTEGAPISYARLLRSLLRARNQLFANVNPTLALDNIFLAFP